MSSSVITMRFHRHQYCCSGGELKAKSCEPTTNDQRPTTSLPKLLQKPHVPLEEELNVIHAVLQKRDAVGANAEGEARYLLRVVAIVLHEFEYVGIDHAAAQDFDPAGSFAGTTGLAP